MIAMSNHDRKIGPIDPENKYSIYASAFGIMAIFADSLLEIIDAKLSQLFGPDWQAKLVQDQFLDQDQNLRDVHALLKELARNGMSQLRMPFNERIPKKELRGTFYDELDNLLAERNAWVHRKVEESKKELIGLVELIKVISEMIELSTSKACEELITQLKQEAKTTQTVLPIDQEKSSEPVNVAVPLATEHIWKIGEAISFQFTSHSYSISGDLDVLDRVSGQPLSKVAPKTLERLKPSLKSLRPGARLRLTPEGVLSAFFSEHWGYLDTVTKDEWFANHLS